MTRSSKTNHNILILQPSLRVQRQKDSLKNNAFTKQERSDRTCFKSRATRDVTAAVADDTGNSPLDVVPAGDDDDDDGSIAVAAAVTSDEAMREHMDL